MRAAIERRVPLFTSNLVLAEVHRLLLFRAGIEPAAAALERIDASKRAQVKYADAAIHRESRAWLKKLRDQKISYTDATSFALMKAHKCDFALSFDKDFLIAGFSLWA